MECKKPSREILEKWNVLYSDDNIFAAKARLLQSMWRERELKVLGIGKSPKGSCYGNFLPMNWAKEEGLNFLNKKIFELVKEKVENKDDALIQEPRIWNNMLSSQPLAFNLFGELALDTDLEIATKVFSKLLPNIKKVLSIKFEYSPGRLDPRYTNDKTAFDVFIEYQSNNNEKGFLGIEVKYAEDMKDKVPKNIEKYLSIANELDIFLESSFESLMQNPLQQIWRDHLLALSMYKLNTDYKEGAYLFIYPKCNHRCATAFSEYKESMKPGVKDDLYSITIEELLEEIKQYAADFSNPTWIYKFFDRYLNFDKLKDA